MYTINDIIRKCEIPDSSKIEYGTIEGSYGGVAITDYSFYYYKIGRNEIEGEKCYIKSDGSILTKSCTIGGIRYKFLSDGICQGKYTGWIKSASGIRYYKNGVTVTNKWLKPKSGKIHYAGADGYMRTGWAKITRGKGIFSYFDKNGVWDGNTYYVGYNPENLYSFFLDYDFFSCDEYYYAIGNHAAKNMKKFDGVDIFREIIDKNLYTSLSKDKSSSDDETELSGDIYHGDKIIVIRGSVDKNADFELTKDSKGNSYLYNRL